MAPNRCVEFLNLVSLAGPESETAEVTWNQVPFAKQVFLVGGDGFFLGMISDAVAEVQAQAPDCKE